MKKHLKTILDHLPYVGKLREADRQLRGHLAGLEVQIEQLELRLIKEQKGSGVYAAGHYYSPVPDLKEVDKCLGFKQLQESARKSNADVFTVLLPDLDLNHPRQLELLGIYSEYYKELPFCEKKEVGKRYYYDQSYFCYADAIFLYCFLRNTQPKKIIEVGSGFSSAVILDSAEYFLDHKPEITFVEPYPDRLKSILEPQDYAGVTIREEKVQEVPLDIFKALQAGDLLFIDSSHVVKFGNDLQFLFFEVLPVLAPGVYVHFHDIFYPFEYPVEWLRDGRYWNEAYFLRAFLANNSNWTIQFFNTYVATMFQDVLRKEMPLCLKNTGGSIYLQKRV